LRGLLQCNEAAAGRCMEAQQPHLAQGCGVAGVLAAVVSLRASRLTLPEPLATLQHKQDDTHAHKEQVSPVLRQWERQKQRAMPARGSFLSSHMHTWSRSARRWNSGGDTQRSHASRGILSVFCCVLCAGAPRQARPALNPAHATSQSPFRARTWLLVLLL
jgi:hypothetical protein